MAKYILIILFPVFITAQSIQNSVELPQTGVFFHNFGNNILHSFTNSYGLYHVTAITSSYGLVESGVDWQYYKFMRNNKFIGYSFFPSVIAGQLVPLAVPLYLYFKSRSDNDAELMYTSMALGQAALAAYLITSSYKAITGRDGPEIFGDDAPKTDYSKNFHFGFFENGIFHGWPSGHTTTAVAMSVTLIELYPENKMIQTVAAIYGLYIGIGISTNIHWLSDFVSGILIGYSIGKTVGKSFKQLMGDKSDRENFSISPTLNGISFQYSF